jgi:methionine sulfoxide reductase heme-binding subunit
MREGQLPCARKASMLTGGYHLLLQFSIFFGKRVPDMPLYALFLIPMLAVFALLMIAMASKPKARALQAG